MRVWSSEWDGLPPFQYQAPLKNFHLRINMCCVPLLGLKGNYHDWKYVIFCRGLKQMGVNKPFLSASLTQSMPFVDSVGAFPGFTPFARADLQALVFTERQWDCLFGGVALSCAGGISGLVLSLDEEGEEIPRKIRCVHPLRKELRLSCFPSHPHPLVFQFPWKSKPQVAQWCSPF